LPSTFEDFILLRASCVSTSEGHNFVVLLFETGT